MSSNIKYLTSHRAPGLPIQDQAQVNQPESKPDCGWRGTGAAVFRPGHIAAGFSSGGVVTLITPELHQEIVLQVLDAAVPLNRPALQATILKFDLALRRMDLPSLSTGQPWS